LRLSFTVNPVIAEPVEKYSTVALPDVGEYVTVSVVAPPDCETPFPPTYTGVPRTSIPATFHAAEVNVHVAVHVGVNPELAYPMSILIGWPARALIRTEPDRDTFCVLALFV
jgi:hypothetical protein